MLKAHDLSKAYDGDPLFASLSFVLGPGDRVGLVGPNGAGKSTLLRLLAGDDRPDTGAVQLGPHDRIGSLAQEAAQPDLSIGRYLLTALGEVFELHGELARLEAALAEGSADAATLRRYGAVQERYGQLDGWTFDRQVAEARDHLGIAHLRDEARFRDLSGGEQARVMLAGVLLSRPTILLLDEPTNHLDLDGTRWLEDFLAAFGGTLLVVSHDRRFLDTTVTRIFELGGPVDGLELYEGGYTAYRAEKSRRRERQIAEFEAQEKYRRRLEADIARTRQQASRVEQSVHGGLGSDQTKRYAKKVAKKALSRERRLTREMGSADWVREPEDGPSFKVKLGAASEPGRRLASLRGVTVQRGGRAVLEGADLDVHGRDRVAVLGRNGSGKSTLLSLLDGTLRPDAGAVDVAARVALLPQTHDDLPADRPLLGWFRSQVVMHESEARTLLGHFLFEQDRIHRPIGTLSPGERSRLLVAALVASGAELLLLDEPTNHLDFDSLDVVEAALRRFAGTLVVVSHDRAFIENLGCDRVLDVRDGRLAERAAVVPGEPLRA